MNFGKTHFFYRHSWAWDSHPDVGYVTAGGYNAWSGSYADAFKVSKIVERSTDNGSSFQTLPDIPYGCSAIISGQCDTSGSGSGGLFGACLVIIDSNTIFIAGGRMGMITQEICIFSSDIQT